MTHYWAKHPQCWNALHLHCFFSWSTHFPWIFFPSSCLLFCRDAYQTYCKIALLLSFSEWSPWSFPAGIQEYRHCLKGLRVWNRHSKTSDTQGRYRYPRFWTQILKVGGGSQLRPWSQKDALKEGRAQCLYLRVSICLHSSCFAWWSPGLRGLL